MKKKKQQIYVGVSGWTFPGWRKQFYPAGLKQKEELHYASRQLTSIEINGTFYRMQKPQSFQNWYDQTPDDFLFSLKGSQFITHTLRAKEVDVPMANFFASGILLLKQKLGPILWQFPPHVMLKDDRFEQLIELLPQNSQQAEDLANQSDEFMNGRRHCDAGGDYVIRHCFEFRHKSFLNKDFVSMLREKNIGFVFADSGKRSVPVSDITSDFVYLRMHGALPQQEKGYQKGELAQLLGDVQTYASGLNPVRYEPLLLKPASKKKRLVFVYFDNEEKHTAPSNALWLLKNLAEREEVVA